jgi:hypothetical protein
MALKNPLACFLFTAVWARRLNRAGFRVRAVHNLFEATVWDGAEERVVRFYLSSQQVPDAGNTPVADGPASPAPAAGPKDNLAPAEFLWHDSRQPFPVAIGSSRRLAPRDTEAAFPERSRRASPPPATEPLQAYLAD